MTSKELFQQSKRIDCRSFILRKKIGFKFSSLNLFKWKALFNSHFNFGQD
jgi:hypothetical protein